jgi:hypothetical protein
MALSLQEQVGYLYQFLLACHTLGNPTLLEVLHHEQS